MGPELDCYRAQIAAFTALNAVNRGILLRARAGAEPTAPVAFGRRETDRTPLAVFRALHPWRAATTLATMLDAALDRPRRARRAVLLDGLARHAWRYRPGGGAVLVALRAARRVLAPSSSAPVRMARDALSFLVEPALAALLRREVARLLVAERPEHAGEFAFIDGRYGFRHAFRPLLGPSFSSAEVEVAARRIHDFIGAIAPDLEPETRPELSLGLAAFQPQSSGSTESAPVARALAPLVQAARRAGLQVVLDPEPAIDLELALDVLDQLILHPDLADATLGLALDICHPAALAAVDFLIELAQVRGRRLVVRLVDTATCTEPRACVDPIEEGIAYHACARTLLGARDAVLPVFATHDPVKIEALRALAGDEGGYEFMRLHGHAARFYRPLIEKRDTALICRVHAPVGRLAEARSYIAARLAALDVPGAGPAMPRGSTLCNETLLANKNGFQSSGDLARL